MIAENSTLSWNFLGFFFFYKIIMETIGEILIRYIDQAVVLHQC